MDDSNSTMRHLKQEESNSEEKEPESKSLIRRALRRETKVRGKGSRRRGANKGDLSTMSNQRSKNTMPPFFPASGRGTRKNASTQGWVHRTGHRLVKTRGHALRPQQSHHANCEKRNEGKHGAGEDSHRGGKRQGSWRLHIEVRKRAW